MSKPHTGLVAVYEGHTQAGKSKGIVLGYRRAGVDPENGEIIAKAMVAMAAHLKCGVNRWAFWVDDPEIAPSFNAADQITAANAVKALEAGLEARHMVECINTRRGLKVRIGAAKPFVKRQKGANGPANEDTFLAILAKLGA